MELNVLSSMRIAHDTPSGTLICFMCSFENMY